MQRLRRSVVSAQENEGVQQTVRRRLATQQALMASSYLSYGGVGSILDARSASNALRADIDPSAQVCAPENTHNKIAFYSNADHPRVYVHLVARGHSRSRDKDGGHTIRPAIVENHMCTHTHGSVFCRTGIIADRRFTVLE